MSCMTLSWRTIPDFPNYEICQNGEIRNSQSNTLLKHQLNKGYHRVALYNDSGKFYKSVHRLVAETFHGLSSDKSEVNHISGNKNDNTLDNLEFCTRSENMKHAYRAGLKTPSGGLPNKPLKVIETGKIYFSAYECARQLNCDQRHINHCLMGKRKTHKGYHFEYVESGSRGLD